jgi:hypothetical protein
LFAAAVVSSADEGRRQLVLLHGGHCTDALLQTVTALDAHSLEVVFTEDAPEARVAHAGVCVGGSSLIVFGGTNMLHPPAHDDCLMFDTGSKQWYLHGRDCVLLSSLLLPLPTPINVHAPAINFSTLMLRRARGSCRPLPDRFAHGMAACGRRVSCSHSPALNSRLLTCSFTFDSLQIVVAGGINFERDLDDVWVADVPDTHAVYAAAAAVAAADKGLESTGSDDQ